MALDQEKPSPGSQGKLQETDTVPSGISKATHQTTEIILESSPEFSPSDIGRWKQGAASYRKFCEEVPLAERTQFFSSGKRERLPDPLRPLFLGEKPALFECHFSAPEITALKKIGFETAGGYLYDPTAVASVIEQHREEFQNLPTATPQALMEHLAAADLQELPIPRGLVLGLPLESVRAFEKAHALRINKIAEQLLQIFGDDTPDKAFLENAFFGDRGDKEATVHFFAEKLSHYRDRLGITEEDIPILLEELQFLLNSHTTNVHGVIWIDYGDSPESNAKQKRLKAAFEYSGILETQS